MPAIGRRKASRQNEEVGSKTGGNPLVGDSVAAHALELLEEWRGAVRDQWLPAELQLSPGKLREALDLWKGFGLDPGELLYLILGTEWIFRARPVTGEDIERELGKIESNLAKPGHPVLEPWQASLVTSALAPSIRAQMAGQRYLVSLGRWTMPDRHRSLELLAHARSESPPPRQGPRRLLEGKTGPVPKVGPIVAALVAEAIARERNLTASSRRSVGIAIARLLLCREVVSSELLGWGRVLERLAAASSASTGGGPSRAYREWRTVREAEKALGVEIQPSLAVLDWIVEKWRRNAKFQLWAGYSESSVRIASQQPSLLFNLVAEPMLVSWLYALRWSSRAAPPTARRSQ